MDWLIFFNVGGMDTSIMKRCARSERIKKTEVRNQMSEFQGIAVGNGFK